MQNITLSLALDGKSDKAMRDLMRMTDDTDASHVLRVALKIVQRVTRAYDMGFDLLAQPPRHEPEAIETQPAKDMDREGLQTYLIRLAAGRGSVLKELAAAYGFDDTANGTNMLCRHAIRLYHRLLVLDRDGAVFLRHDRTLPGKDDERWDLLALEPA